MPKSHAVLIPIALNTRVPTEICVFWPGNAEKGTLLKGFAAGHLLVSYKALYFLLELFGTKAGTSSAVPEAESFLWVSLTHRSQASRPNDKKLELKCEEQRLINNEDNEITRTYRPNPHLNYLTKTGNSNHTSRAFHHAPCDEYWWIFCRHFCKNTFCVCFSPAITSSQVTTADKCSAWKWDIAG